MKFGSYVKIFLFCFSISISSVYGERDKEEVFPEELPFLNLFDFEDRVESKREVHLSATESQSIERGKYPGVVLLTVKGEPAGTAFFIAPDTLATNFYNVFQFKGSVRGNLSFLDPVTSEPQPVTEISALSMEQSLALLKTDYHSKTFYSVNSSEDERDEISLEKVVIPGFLKDEFRILKGRVGKTDHFINSEPIKHEERRRGLFDTIQAAPVFSEEGYLKGMVTAYDSLHSNLLLGFESIQKLKDLQSEPSLFCTTSSCIEKEVEKTLSEALEGNRDSQFSMGVMEYEEATAHHLRMELFSVWSLFMDEEGKKQIERIGSLLSQKYKSVVHWLRKAAEQGHIEAQFSLGILYLMRLGVERNLKEAAYWVHKAAKRDFVLAQFYLGWIYSGGKERENNFREAAYQVREYKKREDVTFSYRFQRAAYYSTAADEGEIMRDWSQALYWYEKAAVQGHIEAQFQLGLIYLKGMGEVAKDLKKAVRWLREAGELGHIEAQFRLGWLYSGWDGIERNLKEAFYWYAQAASENQPMAQFFLGQMYLHGDGVKRDTKKAVYWHKEAAQQGVSLAQTSLGLEYLRGEVVERDLQEARNWFRRAVERNHVGAKFYLDWIDSRGEKLEEDLKALSLLLEKRASRGYIEDQDYMIELNKIYFQQLEELKERIVKEESMAVGGRGGSSSQQIAADNKEGQFSLGLEEYQKAKQYEEELRLLYSWTVLFFSQDKEAAKEIGTLWREVSILIFQKYRVASFWFREAGELGHRGAQFHLGTMYLNGQGMEHNEDEAIRWLREAALQGHHREAQFHLGNLYLGRWVEEMNENREIETDEMERIRKEALYWFREAALQGHREAQFHLGLYYSQGEEEERDLGTAFTWFREAAKQGDAKAQMDLGLMYLKGDGVEVDLREAARLLHQSALQGNRRAQSLYGAMHLKGQGMPKDLEQALYWFREAELQGHDKAQLLLGLMYREGEGVEKNLMEAAQLFYQSAVQGNQQAQFYLGLMYLLGEAVGRNLAQAAYWFQQSGEWGYTRTQVFTGAIKETLQRIEEELAEDRILTTNGIE